MSGNRGRKTEREERWGEDKGDKRNWASQSWDWKESNKWTTADDQWKRARHSWEGTEQRSHSASSWQSESIRWRSLTSKMVDVYLAHFTPVRPLCIVNIYSKLGRNIN